MLTRQPRTRRQVRTTSHDENYFFDCLAEVYFDSQGLDFLADGVTDTVINMVVNGTMVATTTVETPTLIQIAYTGRWPAPWSAR
jgi:hypothetical protein